MFVLYGNLYIQATIPRNSSPLAEPVIDPVFRRLKRLPRGNRPSLPFRMLHVPEVLPNRIEQIIIEPEDPLVLRRMFRGGNGA